MNLTTIIPLIAIILSILTFVINIFGIKNKANQDYVSSLEDRIKVLEENLRVCQIKREELLNENLVLMKKFIIN